MAASLDAFFETMGPFLERRLGVVETVRALGPSPSGSARLALYPEFIRRQKRSVLDHFFAAVRAACDAHDATLWHRLVEEFIEEVPPRHWEPNHYAKPMLEFLETRQKREPSISSAVPELADFAWIRYSAMIAAHSEDSDPALGRAMFVRQYAHEVATYARAVEDGTSTPGASPEVRPCTVLVCRSRHTERLEIVRPSVAALIALRRREAPQVERRLPKELAESDVEGEDAALVALGILAPRSVAPFGGRRP